MMLCQIAVFMMLISSIFSWNRYLPQTMQNLANIQSKSRLYVFDFFNNKNNKEKEAIQEEQMKAQREILERRRNRSKMNEYYDQVEERRKKVAIEAKITEYAKSDDRVDPIEQWKEAKKQGKVKDLGYEDEPPRSSSILGVNIIIPTNPIGNPKYDAGQRFDLRLPYAERGYEDKDADVMGKIAKGFASFFGGKKEEKKIDKVETKKPEDDYNYQPRAAKKK